MDMKEFPSKTMTFCPMTADLSCQNLLTEWVQSLVEGGKPEFLLARMPLFLHRG